MQDHPSLNSQFETSLRSAWNPGDFLSQNVHPCTWSHEEAIEIQTPEDILRHGSQVHGYSDTILWNYLLTPIDWTSARPHSQVGNPPWDHLRLYIQPAVLLFKLNLPLREQCNALDFPCNQRVHPKSRHSWGYVLFHAPDPECTCVCVLWCSIAESSQQIGANLIQQISTINAGNNIWVALDIICLQYCLLVWVLQGLVTSAKWLLLL